MVCVPKIVKIVVRVLYHPRRLALPHVAKRGSGVTGWAIPPVRSGGDLCGRPDSVQRPLPAYRARWLEGADRRHLHQFAAPQAVTPARALLHAAGRMDRLSCDAEVRDGAGPHRLATRGLPIDLAGARHAPGERNEPRGPSGEPRWPGWVGGRLRRGRHQQRRRRRGSTKLRRHRVRSPWCRRIVARDVLRPRGQ